MRSKARATTHGQFAQIPDRDKAEAGKTMRDNRPIESDDFGTDISSLYADTDAGRDLVVCEDAEDMFKKLGI